MDFGAIVLDTQTIDNYHWRFDDGMLNKMKQFQLTEIDFLFPDVIKSEVQAHLTKRIKDVQENVEKALKEAELDKLLTQEDCIHIQDDMMGVVGAEAFAASRINQFILDCGAIELSCAEYTNLKDVFESYFNHQPPFKDTKKRKEEFPDAVILFALQKFAEIKKVKVIVVSRDAGWADFCEHSEYIDCFKDLGDALNILQPKTAPFSFAQRLSNDIYSGAAADLLSALEAAVIRKYDNIDFIPDADSYLRFEYETGSCRVEAVDFDNEVNVLEVNEEHANFEIKVRVRFIADCDFSFYHYDSIDKDNIYLASSSEETEEEIETSILFTVYDGYESEYSDIIVDEVELTEVIKQVDFGSIEPHFEPDYD